MKTWKRVCAVMLAGLISAAGLPQLNTVMPEGKMVASAETTGTYGDLTYTAYDSCVYITDCDTSATSVEIPEEIDGLPVTRIDDNAFEDCTLLTSVTLPDSIITIESCAFINCSSLESIFLSIYVEYVGYAAFCGCDALKSIFFENINCDIIDSELTIPEQADINGYANSTALEYAMNYNRSYTTMGWEVIGSFGTDNQLQWTYSSDTAALIISGEGAIPNYSSISEAPWLKYENNIRYVIVEDGITEIGNYAFYEMNNVESVSIPDTVTRIGSFAFAYSRIKDIINVPVSVEEIEADAFFECYSVMIQNPSCSLGTDFIGYTGLLYGYDDSTAETYAIENNLPFSNVDFSHGICNGDIKWNLDSDGVLTIFGTGEMRYFGDFGDDTEDVYDDPMTTPWNKVRDQITEIVVEDGITHIGEFAFAKLPNVTSISIA
ncbi:MAG: leucine-rich repeat domain-containing protein, partial [Ruminococcus sp.]